MRNRCLRRAPVRVFALAAVLTILSGPGLEAQERFRRTPPLAEARQSLELGAIQSVDLPGGLKVAVIPHPRSPVVTLQLVILAGEADSPPDLPGVANITARMIGQGTRILSADQIENMIEGIGAEYSVNTYMDYTVFKLDVLGEHLDRALFIMRAMLLDAAFTERALAGVRRVAYRELFERKKDPEFMGWRHLARVLFENHPYHVGTYNEDVIKFIGARDVAAFYGRFYRPANAVFVVSGNIAAEDIVPKIGAHFRAWPRREADRPRVPGPAPNARERVCFIEDEDSQDATILIGNIVMDQGSPDLFPFLVLKQALGGTTRSRLFMNLRESKAYAYYAFSELEFLGTCSLFWARARVAPEFIFPSVSEIIREIRSFSTARAPAAEIEEAKAYLVGNIPLRFQSPEVFSEWTARIAAMGLGSDHWDRILENIIRVNVETVQAAGKRHLSNPPVIVVVGRRDWILNHLKDFRVVEVYDVNGVLKQTIIKGVER
jgi:zinc protease